MNVVMIIEQKIRTQRILGKLIVEGQERKEIATQGNHGKGIQSSVPERDTRTLSDIGITRKDGYNKYGVPEGDTMKTLSDIGITRKESSK